MFRRLKQFVEALFARVSKDDYTFLSDYVTLAERDLFLRMPRYDQRHSLNVGNFLRRHGHSLELVRAGLLHDIGKGENAELTLIRRSLCVLLEKLAPSKVEKLVKWRKGKLGEALYVHLNHPEIGARLLEGLDTDGHIVKLVRYHHDQKRIQRNEELKILRQVDNKF